MLEFERLGIDPDKVAAKAASGERSAVFDLYIGKVDPDWDFPLPTELIILRWTEQAVGDYDQNGEVNIGDLTPISSMGWHRQVLYGNAKYSAAWAPLSAPLDVLGPPPMFATVPLGQKPPEGSGAENWRLARIDGDINGEINISDLTPISLHWRECVSGYRVYRQDPGAADFDVVADVDDPPSGFSIKRSAAYMAGDEQVNPFYAVRYVFNDKPIEAGKYSYYVAPYDAESGTEGPQSNVVTINFQTASDPGDPGDPPPDTDPNVAPQAAFSCEPLQGEAPLSVAFDASGSSDADGLTLFYVWDFDGDGTNDSDYLRTAHIEHNYMQYGTYQPHLTVVDDGGLTSTVSHLVRVSKQGNYPPEAAFSVDPISGKAPLAVQFDASASSDSEDQPLSYIWDWEGDGTEDFDAGANPVTTHEFSEAGSFKPVLRVEDVAGLSATLKLAEPIEVTARQAPVAALTADPTEGFVPLVVSFDASGSSDPEGGALSFDWDWDGDGTYDFNSADDPTASHSYDAPLLCNATVRVTTEFSLSATASVLISANEVPNIPPEAVLHTNPLVDDIAPQTVEFDASASSDADGTLVKYEYDWEGDGEYDYWQGGASLEWHRFEAGSYTPTLRVTDDDGATDTASVQLNFRQNENPVAFLSADPLTGPAPLTVNFDASASYDPLGDALTYQWDWEYHGQFVADETSGPVTWHVFYNVDPHTVAVKVSDNHEGFAIATVDIACTSGWYVIGVAGVGGGGFFPGMGMDIVSGNPAVATSANMWFGSVYYTRGLDARGIAWSEPLMVMDAMLVEEGFNTPSIADVDGCPAVCALAFDGHLWFTMGLDTAGTTWSTPVSIAYTASGTGKSTDMADAGGRPAVAWMDSLGWLCYMRANDATGTSWPDPIKLEKLGNWLWQGRITLLINGIHPSIAYVRESDTTIRYIIGDDLDGASWETPVTVHDVTSAPSCVSALLVNGNPCMAYDTADGVCFQIAPDGFGASWNSPTVVTTEKPTLVNLLSAGGLPGIVTSNGKYYEAADISGLTWLGPEYPGIASTRAMDGGCTTEGLPCFAVSLEDWTAYAVRIP